MSEMIAYFDYRPEYRRLQSEIHSAVQRVFGSGQLILGPEVHAFEGELAAYVGCDHAVGVASGTDAITLALRALGVGAGDEVITVANAGVAPVAAIRAAGATPVFAEVDDDGLLIDPARLEERRTPRTRSVMPVHLYGRPAAMASIGEFAARHGLAVIEDCAHAHGARYRGSHVGALGAIGCFSFYPTKVLGAYGDGGACVTRDPDLARRLRELRMYGFDERRSSVAEGFNSRLDELQASILRVKLAHLDETLAERRALAQRYLDLLAGSSLTLPRIPAETEHAFHLFVVRTAQRDRLVAAMERAEIGHGVHYAEPVHLMQAYAFLGGSRGDLPITEAACRSVLSLPLYPGLDRRDVDRVAECLLDIA
jgi:dTDP-4-amino-4,6-dideoxygalactose transaminase